jgi:hypothetical protein
MQEITQAPKVQLVGCPRPQSERQHTQLREIRIVTPAYETSGSRVLESAAPVAKRDLAVGRLVRTILAALAVALALNIAVCFLPESVYQRWQFVDSDYGRLRWIYERIHYDPRPIDVVILGSSRSQLGLSAPSIEQQLAEHGKNANVVNFAIFNLGRNIQWVILNEVYKVKSPRVIVLEADDPPYPFGHEFFKNVAPAQAIVSAPKQARQEYLNNLIYLPVRKFKLFAANLFPDLFGLIKQFDPEAYERSRTDFTTNFPGETGGIVDMEHSVPRANLVEQSSQQVSRNAWIASQYARLDGGEDRIFIRKIAHDAETHGAQLIFVYMPNFNGSETVSNLDLLKQYGMFIGNGDLASRDELFENWAHLNHAGGVIASGRLADAINRLPL